jgi:hypothetical protein
MNRSYGTKYDKRLGTKEVAELIRRQVRLEARAGLLPQGKWSVTMERFSGGSSITIRFEPPAEWALDFARCFYSHERVVQDAERPHEYSRLPYRSTFGAALEGRLEAMLAEHNHDGSDTSTDYFDVKFYSHVRIGGPDLIDLIGLYKQGMLLDEALDEINPRWARMLADWQRDEEGEPPAHVPEVLGRPEPEPEPEPELAAKHEAEAAKAVARVERHLRLVTSPPPAGPAPRPRARARREPLAVPVTEPATEQAPNPAWARLALADALALDLTIPGLGKKV